MAARTAIQKPAQERERAFALAYIENRFNGAKAAVAIGIPERSAAVQASQLLTSVNVQDILSTELERVRERQLISINEIVSEWKRLAFSNMDDFTFQDDEGNTFIKLPHGNKDLMAAVQSIETIEEPVFNDGEEVGTRRRIKLKLYDKHNALDKITRLAGMYEGKEAPTFIQNNTTIDNRKQIVVIADPAEAAKDYKAFLGR